MGQAGPEIRVPCPHDKPDHTNNRHNHSNNTYFKLKLRPFHNGTVLGNLCWGRGLVVTGGEGYVECKL